MGSNIKKYKRIEEISKSLIDPDPEMRCNHFSFILYKNRIISIGHNCRKTHPINLKNKKLCARTGRDISGEKFTCSEFDAINKLRKLTNIDTKKCTLINIRYNRKQEIALSKPCMSCENLLRYFNFKKVIWTDNHGNYVL